MRNQENELRHFVGTRGSGMSSLALILHQKDYNVQGSGVEEYFFIQRDPERSGVPILPLNAGNIDKDMIVITGDVFLNTHEEIARATELGTEVIHYHDFIARFIKPYTSIAAIGSHGRTGTTGLLARVLSGINPTNYLVGDGTDHGGPGAGFFVFGACGYRRHSLVCSPDYTIMTNIDFDHSDYYKSIEDVFSAFQTMAHQVKKGIFAYGDDKYLHWLESEVPVYYYSAGEENDIQARNVQRTTEGPSLDVYHKDDSVSHLVLLISDHRNIMNVLGVIAVAYSEKLDVWKAAGEVLSFKGVKRRLSEKKVDDMITIDDYACHSAEIRATIDGTRQRYPDREIITVFQPHTFTRTIALTDESAEALDLVDEVFSCNIFSSAHETQDEVRIEDLGEKIQKGGQVVTEDNVSPLLDFGNTVVASMDAGDIQKFRQAYETLLSNTTRDVL